MPSVSKVATDLMSIGRFSEASRLSLKALRLYDAMGLLPPAHTDPVSGYRYYSQAQLKEAKLIGLLRRLEMPLNTIAELLEAEADEALVRLERYWQGVEAEHSERRKLVDYLRDHLQLKEVSMAFKVESRDVPARKILSVTKEVYVDALPSAIGQAYEKLYGYLDKQGVRAAGDGFVVFHGQVDNDSNGPIEVCLPYAGELPADGEMKLSEQPAYKEAFARISHQDFAFPQILKVYDAVCLWVEENGHQTAAPPREVYFADPAKAGRDEPFCDVAWPFR